MEIWPAVAKVTVGDNGDDDYDKEMTKKLWLMGEVWEIGKKPLGCSHLCDF